MPEQLPMMSIVAGLAMFALIASVWFMARKSVV